MGLAIKLMLTHLIMSVIQFLFMPAFFGLWQDNIAFQIFVGLFYIGIFWFIIYADASGRGMEDYRREEFRASNGFFSGAVASIPAILLYIVAFIPFGLGEWENILRAILRIWLVPYTIVFIRFENYLNYIFPIVILIFPILTGLSYLDGERKRKTILAMVEKAKATKSEKSKVGKK